MSYNYADESQIGKIYIVTNLTYQDAISVSGIIDENDIMLFTDRNFLSFETENFLSNISNREIIIVGGNFVINENVRKKIKEIAHKNNLTIREIYGKEAEDTALELIKFKNFSNISAVVIVNKHSMQDCYSASSLVSFLNFHILYTEKDEIPNSTLNILKKLNFHKIIIIGGNAVVSKKVENLLLEYKNVEIERLWGITGIDTNKKVKEFLMKDEKIREKIGNESTIISIKNMSNANLLYLQFKGKFFEITNDNKFNEEEKIRLREIYKEIYTKAKIKPNIKEKINVSINKNKEKENISVPSEIIIYILQEDEILNYINNDIVVFKFLYNPGCPHCEHGMQYLEKLKKKFKDRIVIEKTQVYDSKNWNSFSQECIKRGHRAFPFTLAIGKNSLTDGKINYDAVSYSDGFNRINDYDKWVSNICAQFEEKPEECK